MQIVKNHDERVRKVFVGFLILAGGLLGSAIA